MKNTLILTLIFVGLMASYTQVSAQKIAYVHTQEILQSLPDVKEANANIETFRNQLIKMGEKQITALQQKYQDLEQRQQRGEIAPKQLEVEAQKLKEDEMKIAQFEQESQQKILEKSEELLKPIREKIKKYIDEVAAENGYDYVFDGSMGIILYADESTNATDKVKAKLGL